MRQISARSSFEQIQKCNEFEENILEKPLENRLLSSLADKVYELAFQRFNDYGTLEDLRNRLRAFIGSGKSQRIKTKGVVPLDIPQGLSWGDISMRFIDKECLYIKAGGKSLGNINFAVLGFENKKNGKPDIVWLTLFILGQLDGEISWETKGRSEEDASKVKKNISILRRRLKNLFGISGDPFYPYNKEKAYKTKFIISADKEEI